MGLLGDNKVREIAILCSASGVLRRGVRSYGIMPDEFWLHSISTAISARLLAEIYGPEMRDEAFTAGLLHDIGKLAINRVIEEEQKETIRDTGDGLSPDYYSREMGLYGFDHCTIGFFLARNWNFSDEMTQAIAFHHYPDQESQHQTLIRVVCTADFVAHLVASGEDEERLSDILEEEGMVPLDLSRPVIENIISTLKKETSDSEAFLGI